MPPRRTGTVVLGLTAGVATVLSGCGSSSPSPDYQGVCVDTRTNKRLPDRDCDDCVDDNDDGRCDRSGGRSGFASWYFYNSGRQASRVGGTVSGGSFTTPPKGHSFVAGGIADRGGKVDAARAGSSGKTTVMRGGFGGGGRGFFGG